MKKEKVAILGASHKPERYAYKALIALREAGHECIRYPGFFRAPRELRMLEIINEK